MIEPPPVFICVNDKGSLYRYRKLLCYWNRETFVYGGWRINSSRVEDDDAAKAFAEAVEVYVPIEREDKS